MSQKKSSGNESSTSSPSRQQNTSSKATIVLFSVSLLSSLALLIRLETVQHNNGLKFEDVEKDLKILWEAKLNRGKTISSGHVLTWP